MRPAAGEGAETVCGAGYLDVSAFSRSGLIDHLVHDGYGKSEATAAVDSLTVNYNEQAAHGATQADL